MKQEHRSGLQAEGTSRYAKHWWAILCGWGDRT